MMSERIKMHDIFDLVYKVNSIRGYIAFFRYDGDENSISFSVYKKTEDNIVAPLPIEYMDGIGTDRHNTFDEAERVLSDFLIKQEISDSKKRGR